MERNSFGPETALKVAIQFESNKYKLYQKTILKVKDEESLSILRYLARQERERIRQLKETYQKVTGRRLMAINLNGDGNIKPKLIFNLYKEPLKIFDFAIQNDREAYTYYKDTADYCINPEGRKMFDILTEQKASHIELLRLEYKVRERDFEAAGRNGKSSKKQPEYVFNNYDPVAQFI